MQPLLVGEAAAKAGGEAEKEEQGKGDQQQQQQQQGEKKTERRKSFMSALSMKGSSESVATEQPPAAAAEKEETDVDRKNRKGMDLATTLERIQKNFVITDPRLPDNPIIFASDDFLELTEYSREEIIGRNCRFLQGPDTNPKTVQKIREAINNQEDITVQLLNYTKSGKPFWNLFHLQAVKDTKGMLQYFIGVQLDASQYLDPNIQGLEDRFAQEGEKIIVEAANNIDGAVRDLVDPGSDAKDIWAIHSVPAIVKPHKRLDAAWKAIQEVVAKDGRLGLKHFRPIKPLGAGDTGSVHLVELRDTGRLFAMKAMDKEVMINRNKVHRACTEREILGRLDHPFLPTLYASFQTATHVCLITEFCAGGELYGVLERQKGKRFPESVAKFFAAEVLLALEFLHTQGVVYRDLKPENVLLMDNGHALLSDFDLSFISTSTPKLEPPAPPPLDPKKQKKAKKALKKKKGPMSESERQLWKAELVSLMPMLVAEPSTSSNSFVGTEEYIAPEIINGTGHSSPVDWWAFGIFVHEMIFGRTPFRGRNRQRTFTNVLMKELTFPDTVPASPESKDLMRALLERDPERRLGSKKGAAEIRAHPFFADIDWALIRHKPPPSIPVPLKLLSTEAESTRVSLTGVPEDELEWEEHEARPSESMDYGY
uniref:non-specific serine/threonine protein kinase n=1 Tax=Bambusina borreri TaxID=184494 RepID=A0A126X126_9VIRI|nr:putative LOV domain-containing protein [Bambusina borreri]